MMCYSKAGLLTRLGLQRMQLLTSPQIYPSYFWIAVTDIPQPAVLCSHVIITASAPLYMQRKRPLSIYRSGALHVRAVPNLKEHLILAGGLRAR